MAKFTITFEDSDDTNGLIIVSEPSLHDLLNKKLRRDELSMAMYFALAAWKAIGDEAKKVAIETGGACAVGNVH